MYQLYNTEFTILPTINTTLKERERLCKKIESRRSFFVGRRVIYIKIIIITILLPAVICHSIQTIPTFNVHTPVAYWYRLRQKRCMGGGQGP